MIRRRPEAENTIKGPAPKNVYWEMMKKQSYACPACGNFHDTAGRQLDERGKLMIPPTCPHTKGIQ